MHCITLSDMTSQLKQGFPPNSMEVPSKPAKCPKLEPSAKIVAPPTAGPLSCEIDVRTGALYENAADKALTLPATLTSTLRVPTPGETAQTRLLSDIHVENEQALTPILTVILSPGSVTPNSVPHTVSWPPPVDAELTAPNIPQG